ncbi:hypothetical protein V2J09_008646 [Rumex salicifolius]
MILSASLNQPWESTLSLLHQVKSSSDVSQLHARLITTGLIGNPLLTQKLILQFCSSGHPPLIQFARYVFLSHHTSLKQLSPSDPFLWNAVIKSYSHGNDDPERAILIFSLMLENGVCADVYSLSLALKACFRSRSLRPGMQIHGLLRKLEFGSELYVQNCLITLYLRCGEVELAGQVFDRMPKRDSVSYNLMIDGYAKNGMLDSARIVFDHMPVEERNLVSWNSMIGGYVQSEAGLNVASELFEKMPERDLFSWNLMINGNAKCGRMDIASELFNRMGVRDVVSWATMIDGYAKLGKLDVARVLFEQIPEIDSVVCNAMISGYVQNSHCIEALDLFYHMLSLDESWPDITTFTVVLTAVAQLGKIDDGLRIHRCILDNKLAIKDKLAVSLIDMYSKCGSIDDAVKVFAGLEGKNVDHWNAMIGGFARHGLGDTAFEFMMEMQRISLKPDDITFIGVLNACGHAGLLKEGQICFELMRRVHKLEPKLQHFGCMVDILGRAGHIEEAVRFIEEMPMEPNGIVWRTLLSHCINYDNLCVGMKVAEHLMSSDSSYSGSYVLLSNLYAEFGMWEDVSRIRSLMKKRELKKVPGRSSIELMGVVHEFFVEDKSHSEADQVYSMLESLSGSGVSLYQYDAGIQKQLSYELPT